MGSAGFIIDAANVAWAIHDSEWHNGEESPQTPILQD